jgi:hypothetical protein
VTNSKTYTVTEATTLTITDCPCTVIETPSGTPYVPVVPSETPEVPVPTSKAPEVPEVPYPSSNGTAPAPVYPTGTGAPAPSSSAPVEFPGAASHMGASGALLAVAGALAAFL